jgi:tetratricopeptide (TPR) repeat protein
MRSAALALALLLAATPALAVEQAADAEKEMAIADSYMQQGNFQAAVAHYQAARLLAPDRPGPYRALGMAHYKAGQCPEAIPVLEEYVRKKRQDPWPEAVRALADCKARGARGARAVGTFRVTSDPPGADVRIDDAGGPVVGTTPFESASLPAGLHTVYLSRVEHRPASGEVRIDAGVMSTFHIVLAPLSARVTREERARLEREAEERRRREEEKRRQVDEYEKSQAFEGSIAEQINIAYEREKIEVHGSGTDYQFGTAHGRITENEFVRRYKKVTGQKDLNHALKMRNNVSTGVWASFGFAGVGLLAYGLATLSSSCGDLSMMDALKKSECHASGSSVVIPGNTFTNDTSRNVALVGGGVQIFSSIIYLLYGGLRPDGTPAHHVLSDYDARLAVDRYNRALQRRIRNDIAAGRPVTFMPPELAPPSAPKVRLTPFLGAGTFGVSGSF